MLRRAGAEEERPPGAGIAAAWRTRSVIVPCYRITDWLEHFENNRTKELVKMTWVPVPNKHDGDGYTELLDHPEGPAHFGVWIILVEVASKCDPRGTLVRQGRNAERTPHTAASLSRMTRFPDDVIAAGMVRLYGIGWLELIDLNSGDLLLEPQLSATPPQEGATTPQEPAALRVHAGARAGAHSQNGREGKGTEGTEGKKGAASSRTPPPELAENSVLVFECQSGKWGLSPEKLAEYQTSYPHIDVLGELRIARQWAIDNPAKRKTPGGMPSFLSRWLAKAVDTGRAAPRRGSGPAMPNLGGPPRRSQAEEDAISAEMSRDYLLGLLAASKLPEATKAPAREALGREAKTGHEVWALLRSTGLDVQADEIVQRRPS